VARLFDGASSISFGSDASIDGYASKTIAFHIYHSLSGASNTRVIVAKSNGMLTPNGWIVNVVQGTGNSGRIEFIQDWSLTDGQWQTPTSSLSSNQTHSVAIVYSSSATGNDPTIYIDGVSQTLTEVTSPSGSVGSDAAQNLILGTTDAGTNLLGGHIEHFTYDNTLWTAAQVNRHHWYGRPGGAVQVYHPLWTETLTNKGTATADGTNSGTTVVNSTGAGPSAAKVQRP
jgi:hypothetical protein